MKYNFLGYELRTSRGNSGERTTPPAFPVPDFKRAQHHSSCTNGVRKMVPLPVPAGPAGSFSHHTHGSDVKWYLMNRTENAFLCLYTWNITIKLHLKLKICADVHKQSYFKEFMICQLRCNGWMCSPVATQIGFIQLGQRRKK